MKNLKLFYNALVTIVFVATIIVTAYSLADGMHSENLALALGLIILSLLLARRSSFIVELLCFFLGPFLVFVRLYDLFGHEGFSSLTGKQFIVQLLSFYCVLLVLMWAGQKLDVRKEKEV